MTEAGPSARPREPWLLLAVLLAIYIVNFTDRYLITGLIGPIKAEFALGDGTVGLVMGPAFVVLYVLLGVPLARLADRGSRVHIIAGGCLLWSAATVSTGFAIGPVSLGLSRVAVGIGEAAFVAPAYSLIADYFSVDRRGRAFAVMGLATYLGQIAGQGGGPAIAAAAGWRFAFWSIGAGGIGLGVMAFMVLREPVRDAAPPPQVPLRELLARLAKAPAYGLLVVAMGLGVLSGVAFGYWAPELFTRSFALDPVAVKSAFAVNFGLSGMAGTVLFGFLSDRHAHRGMAWPALLAAMALGSTTAMVILATWMPHFGWVSLLAIPAGLLGGGWSVGLHATMQALLPVNIRASATALYIAISTLIGQFAGPFAVGLISEGLGGDAHALRLALTIVMPFGFLGGACAWLAARHVPTDQAALARRLA